MDRQCRFSAGQALQPGPGLRCGALQAAQGQRSLDRSASRATIYRALPLLVGSNVIREMDVGRDQKYYLAEAGSATFRAQLICENCDSIVEVDAPFMQWYGKAVAAKHGMRPLSQKLQVTASCLNDRCPRRKPARS